MSSNKQLSPKQSLRLYQKSYKGGGTNDIHFAVFQQAQQFTQAKRVLYPGCHRHLTASLIFPSVTYIDYDSKVAPLYSSSSKKGSKMEDSSSVVRDYVNDNKIYSEASNYRFHCCNVLQSDKKLSKAIGCDGNDDDSEQYDLLISLSAGVIAEACTSFMAAESGYLLVNDSHSDARSVFVRDNPWKLVAYWDDETQEFSTKRLDQCFQVVVTNARSEKNDEPSKKKKSVPMTLEHVQESINVGSVSKRSFKALFEPHFYLFQKVE